MRCNFALVKLLILALSVCLLSYVIYVILLDTIPSKELQEHKYLDKDFVHQTQEDKLLPNIAKENEIVSGSVVLAVYPVLPDTPAQFDFRYQTPIVDFEYSVKYVYENEAIDENDEKNSDKKSDKKPEKDEKMKNSQVYTEENEKNMIMLPQQIERITENGYGIEFLDNIAKKIYPYIQKIIKCINQKIQSSPINAYYQKLYNIYPPRTYKDYSANFQILHPRIKSFIMYTNPKGVVGDDAKFVPTVNSLTPKSPSNVFNSPKRYLLEDFYGEKVYELYKKHNIVEDTPRNYMPRKIVMIVPFTTQEMAMNKLFKTSKTFIDQSSRHYILPMELDTLDRPHVDRLLIGESCKKLQVYNKKNVKNKSEKKDENKFEKKNENKSQQNDENTTDLEEEDTPYFVQYMLDNCNGYTDEELKFVVRPISYRAYVLVTYLKEIVQQVYKYSGLELNIDRPYQMLASMDSDDVLIAIIAIVLSQFFLRGLIIICDIEFWKGLTDYSSFSSTTIWLDLVLSFFLVCSSTCTFKFTSVFNMIILAWKLQTMWRIRMSLKFPLFIIPHTNNCSERCSTRLFALLLFVMLCGVGLFQLYYIPHSGWAAWAGDTAATVAYAVGIIAIFPQVYKNHKLKTTSHLPWKILTLSAFCEVMDRGAKFFFHLPPLFGVKLYGADIVWLIFMVQKSLYKGKGRSDVKKKQ